MSDLPVYFQGRSDYTEIISRLGLTIKVGDGIVRAVGLFGVKSGEMV